MRKILLVLLMLFLAVNVQAGGVPDPYSWSGEMALLPDIQEEDGDPFLPACFVYKVTNGDLTGNLDGSCSIATASDAATAEVNNLETIVTDIEDDEVPIGSASDDSVYTAIPDCNVEGSALAYEDSTNTISCRSGFSVGGATVSDVGDCDGPLCFEGTEGTTLTGTPGSPFTFATVGVDEISFKPAGVQSVLMTASGNTLTNVSTGTLLQLNQNEELGNAEFILHAYTNTEQDLSGLVKFHSDNADSSTTVFTLTNDGSGGGQNIDGNGVGYNLRLDSGANGPHIRFVGDPTVASPVDGDFWFTGSALNFRNGATTVDLLSKGAIAGQAWTGLHDFGAADLELPQDQTAAAIGEVDYDTTDKTLVIHDGTAARVVGHDIYTYGPVSFEDDGDFTNDEILVGRGAKDFAITIVEVLALTYGATVEYNIEERAWGSEFTPGTDIYTVDAIGSTTGNSETSFSNASIAADAGLYAVPSTDAGATGVSITIRYRKNLE